MRRGFTLIELVMVLALIAVVATVVLTRGDANAAMRQNVINEEEKVRHFIARAFSVARAHNQPVEIVVSGNELVLRTKYDAQVVDRLATVFYRAPKTGVALTVYPSGRVQGSAPCPVQLSYRDRTVLYAVLPGGNVQNVDDPEACAEPSVIASTPPPIPKNEDAAPPVTTPPPPPSSEPLPPPPPGGGETSTGSLRVHIDNPAVSASPKGEVHVLDPDSRVLGVVVDDRLFSGLKVGPYRLRAQTVTIEGCAYEPEQATYSVSVLPNQTSTAVVRYRTGDAEIRDVTIDNTPVGVEYALDPRGGTATLGFEAFGVSSVKLTDIPDLSDDLPTTLSVDPSFSTTELTFDYRANTEPEAVSYTLTLEGKGCGDARTEIALTQDKGMGTLTYGVSGLPAGAKAQIHLDSADSRCTKANLTLGNETLTEDLPATCEHTLWGERVEHKGHYYEAEPVSFTLEAWKEATATLAYQKTEGYLTLELTRLPRNAPEVTLKLEGEKNLKLTFKGNGTKKLVLPVGDYTVTIVPASFELAGMEYEINPESKTFRLENGDRKAVTFTAGPKKSWVRVTVSGLPKNGQGTITLKGPKTYTLKLANTTKKVLVDPGSYTVTAGEYKSGLSIYKAVPNPERFEVEPGETQGVSVSYKLVPAKLTVQVDHHKAWIDDRHVVWGDADSAFEQKTWNLRPGKYTVRAEDRIYYSKRTEQRRYHPLAYSKKVTLRSGDAKTVRLDYIVQKRTRWCFWFICGGWSGWKKIGD